MIYSFPFLLLFLYFCSSVLAVSDIRSIRLPFGSPRSSLSVHSYPHLSIYSNEKVDRSSIKFHPDDIAWGRYTDFNSTGDGWSRLEIFTKSICTALPPIGTGVCNDHDQSFAAGYVEGSITAFRIYQMISNSRYTPSPALDSFVQNNLIYTRQQVSMKSENDSYWYHVGLVLAQLDGLYEGYKAECSKYNNICDKVSYNDLLYLNLGGDLEDLEAAINGNSEDGGNNFAIMKNKNKKNNKHLESLLKSKQINNPLYWGTGHCSALVKLAEDGSDLFVSHITWSGFNSMMRIMKHYDFQVRTTNSPSSSIVPSSSVTFSAYPGTIESGDDFYLLSPSQLVVIETTIGNSNPDLYKLYTKEDGGIAYWIRNIVSNRLATDAPSWSELFSRENIGTYNNEWIVTDLKKFTKGEKQLKDNTVWILDQLPGYIRSYDVSNVINDKGYFSSYNVPYDPFIFNISGGAAMAEKYGDFFSYDKTPRALIFDRDAPAVQDLSAMKKIMRYNNFQHDPLSRCDCSPYPYSGENAIAARSDLNDPNGKYPFPALAKRPHGATDAKLISALEIQSAINNNNNNNNNNYQHIIHAVVGPTHDQQPVFDWRKADFGSPIAHEGLPDVFDFDWTVIDY